MELGNFLKGKQVLEIFAGNGYLSGCLAERGIAVKATTIFSGHDSHRGGLYHPVTERKASLAVIEFGEAADVLLMCWPTTTWDALLAVQLWGPSKDIVFIGEITNYAKGHLGGCATDEFFDAITVLRKFDSYQGNMLEAAIVCRLSSRGTHPDPIL